MSRREVPESQQMSDNANIQFDKNCPVLSSHEIMIDVCVDKSSHKNMIDVCVDKCKPNVIVVYTAYQYLHSTKVVMGV